MMGTSLQEIPEDSNEEDERLSPVVEATPYEKLLQAVHDPKFSHEVTLEKRVGLYKFCGDIGRGNFSRVKKAVHLLTKDKVAIKIVDRSRLDAKNLRMLSREVSTLESVQHPYILRLFEVVETLGRVHLVTEFIQGGELYYKIVQNGVYTENKAVTIFRQLALAIQHMHNLGYVHRDVKAENVLVIAEEHVKLGDFGFSTQVTGSQHYLNTFCGSPPYASPELFNDDHYIGGPVDIWALGILLFFILIGNMPFTAPTVPQLRSTIIKGEYRIPGQFTPSCVKLIQCILLHNPAHRPNIDQILRCEWVQQRPKRPLSPLHEARSIIQKRKKASFWCTKSRKTSPLSPFQPVKQPEPIDCYTKKYNNVPVEKFKNPLDNEASSATTVIPIHNNLSSNQRNNSLINSSRIVTRRNLKNGQIEIVQNNDIIQVRSYSVDDQSEDFSVESENKDFDKFMMIPTRTNSDANLLRALNPIEMEARKIMRTLGVTDEMLEKQIEQGPRSEIIGIYRIIIMRLKTQKELSSISQQSPVISDKLNNNHYHNQKTKKHNATKCAIL